MEKHVLLYLMRENNRYRSTHEVVKNTEVEILQELYVQNTN